MNNQKIESLYTEITLRISSVAMRRGEMVADAVGVDVKELLEQRLSETLAPSGEEALRNQAISIRVAALEEFAKHIKQENHDRRIKNSGLGVVLKSE